MKILITGVSGFLGNHLQKTLTAEFPQHEILPFDEDICQPVKLNNSADYVFHLAAKTDVPESWKTPADFYNVNVTGTANVLEYCRKVGANLTYVNSYPYGIPLYLPIDENHPQAPNSPYNHSKHLAEDICRFYSENFNVKTTVLRLFNVYGAGQNENFLIPKIIKQALFGDSIEVMDLEPKRDYVYIQDVITALISTMNVTLTNFRVYNVGSGKSYSVAEVCEKINILNKPIISLQQKRQNEVPNVLANIAKIGNELNWQPQTTFENGIAKTIEYYKK
ncbi:MAG: GDP-mannose 4,6-dehydratase [Firmicutes bacterium]|nr:GDP-mannose 4,6-dehydratase [Bacillota bacterium]